MVDETKYSATLKGNRFNHGRTARFDRTRDGYVGILQMCQDGTIERVLLTPKQIKALVRFVEPVL